MTAADARPIVLVTGAAGNLGRSVAKALADGYRIVGLDRRARVMGKGPDDSYPIIAVDLQSDASVTSALQAFRKDHGSRIASVVHLAAYFDFTGEDNPLYQSVNVDDTRRLLRALLGFGVAQFLYPSTMLVHAPCRPGERIDETQPLAPGWAYPKSKAAAEEVLRDEHAMESFRTHCIEGIEVDAQRAEFMVANSLMGVTALVPHIGYDRASRVAHHAHAQGTALRQAALEAGGVSEAEYDAWVDMRRMSMAG